VAYRDRCATEARASVLSNVSKTLRLHLPHRGKRARPSAWYASAKRVGRGIPVRRVASDLTSYGHPTLFNRELPPAEALRLAATRPLSPPAFARNTGATRTRRSPAHRR